MQIMMPTSLEKLNRSQREAVKHETGPLLIIAGPGSGKTRTVVHSIAYAIENGVIPDQILAFSFTVKASEELRHRVAEAVGQEKSSGVQISTFHSFCREVLREDIEKLGTGYTRNFKALEENDQRKVVQAQIDYLQYSSFAKPDDVLNFIAKCKAMDIRPSEARNYAPNPDRSQIYVEIYERYEKHLKNDGTIDYENQQLFTDNLFSNVPRVKAKWQKKFDLIFVDEYQDTDPVQYRIIKALAEKRRNLRVVGDDDQGIYGFRGADIQNILNFEKDYPDAKVITLEQNYRSTQQIVNASRAIADFNPDRREKELFTTNAEGEKVKHLHCADHEEESVAITDFISRALRAGWDPCDFAILCRTSRQTNVFQKTFNSSGILCHVVGESSNTRKNAVSIMTIHKSKGLEFSNVFVVGVCKDLLPHYFANEKEWDEELRLLYVAMTRAKNWLCLSSYDSDESQHERGPSQFLDYIPQNLFESITNTLHHTPIPPRPEERIVPIVPEEAPKYVEPLPIQSDMIVLGVDSGTLNVGWSITQKSSDGYAVYAYNTEQPTGNFKARHKQIEGKINELVVSHSVDAIAVEKLDFFEEGAKDKWFLDVAGCVALIRSIADQHGIECHLYTPQHVKYVATGGDRNASKLDVQKAVKKMCNLQEIPEPDHSADAIAASLCYLRNYLNSSRFQGNTRKQEHYNGGCTHLEDGQYDAAVAEFQKAINIDPILTDAHSGLGRAYLGQGDLEAAENEAKKTLRLDSSYQPAHELLAAVKQAYYDRALAHLNNERYDEAVTQFMETINKYSNFTAAYCGLGHAYLGQDDLEAAKNEAKKALRFDSSYQPAYKLLKEIKRAYYDRALAHLKNERYSEAIAQFKDIINRYSNFTTAYCGLGRAYLGQGNLREAQNVTKRTLALDSSYQPACKLLKEIKRAYYDRGLTRLKDEKYGEAITDFKGAISIDPVFTDAHSDLGHAYLGQGNLREAENEAEKVLRLEDNDYPPARELLEEIKRAYYDRGLTHLVDEKYSEAITDFKGAINRDPIFKEAYCGLSRAYYRQGDLEDAENASQKALELDSSYQPAHKLLEDIKQVNYDRGRAHWSNKQCDAAITYFKRAIDIELEEAYCGLGRACYRQGDLEDAKNASQKVLDLDSSYQPAHKLLKEIKQTYFNRGRDYLSKKQYNEAVTEFKKVIDIDPDHKNAHYCRGAAYYWSGMFVDAICSYQAAIAIDSSNKIIYLMLGLAHINTGSYDSAVSQFQKAIDIDRDCKQAHLYLGRTYFKMNKLEDAKQATRKALDIDLTYQRALQLLEDIKQRKDRSPRLLRGRK